MKLSELAAKYNFKLKDVEELYIEKWLHNGRKRFTPQEIKDDVEFDDKEYCYAWVTLNTGIAYDIRIGIYVRGMMGAFDSKVGVQTFKK
jgi:hypothetical protein